jgi:type VI secretion system protein ImpC
MKTSIQKKLSKYLPPRVHITYDLDLEGAVVKKEIPCIIGVIGDYTGLRKEDFKDYNSRSFIFIDSENFNDVITSFKPCVNVLYKVENEDKAVELNFKSINEFHPLEIIKKIPEAEELSEKKLKLTDLKVRLANNPLFLKELKASSDSNAIVTKVFANKSEEQKTFIKELIDLYASLGGKGEVLDNVQEALSKIEDELGSILNEVLHNKDFQKLESSIKGLYYLVHNTQVSSMLKIRVLNADNKEIYDDLKNAPNFDRSFLFRKLYEEEFGTYGGNPYSLLVIDYSISRNQRDFDFLNRLTEVVAAPHLGVVMGVSPDLFDIDSYEDLHVPKELEKLFDSPELASYKSFRESEDSKYVALVLPKYMSRIPYGNKTDPIEGINYEEKIEHHTDFLWSNSCYVYAQKIAESFSNNGWFTSIIGAENGGLVSELPVYTQKTADGDVVIKCPVETIITDRRERELSKLGFISLCYCKDTDTAVFFGAQSTNKVLKYSKEEANANAALSAEFQNTLNVSRFAHYLKCIVRDKIGSFEDTVSLQKFLNDWISDYVLLNSTASAELKAQYPLNKAKIEVFDIPGQPGCYKASVHMLPFKVLKEITISVSLVNKIK